MNNPQVEIWQQSQVPVTLEKRTTVRRIKNNINTKELIEQIKTQFRLLNNNSLMEQGSLMGDNVHFHGAHDSPYSCHSP